MYISHPIILLHLKYFPYHRLSVQIFDIPQTDFDILSWIKGTVNMFDSERTGTIFNVYFLMFFLHELI